MFGAVELLAKRGGVVVSVVPKFWWDDASSRHRGGCAAGDVGHDDDFCSEKRVHTNILRKVVIVADQETEFAAEEFDDVVAGAGCEVGIDEGVELVESRDEAIG